MQYLCSVCGEKVEGTSAEYIEHTEKHIVDIIKDKHPDWEEKDGLCRKCYEYYKKELQGS